MIAKDASRTSGRLPRTIRVILCWVLVTLILTFRLDGNVLGDTTRTSNGINKNAALFVSVYKQGEVYNPSSDMCLEEVGEKESYPYPRCRLNPCDNESSAKATSQRLKRGFAVRYPESVPLPDIPRTMQVAGSAEAGSGCALSDKYGFLFIHNLKVGGTTTKSFIREALCPGSKSQKRNTTKIPSASWTNPAQNSLGQEKTSNVTTAPMSKVRDRPSYVRKILPKTSRGKSPWRKPPFECSKGSETLRIVSCKSGLRIAKEKSYFVWSFVRNPFSRLYSGYAMAMARSRGSYREEDKDGPSFRDFALASQSERRQMSRTDMSHYLPQSNFLADRGGCPIFDYVGRLEYYAEDLLRSIQHIEKRYRSKAGEQASLTPTPLMMHFQDRLGPDGRIQAVNGTSYGKRRKENHVDGGIASAYSDKEVVQKVVREYKADFNLFGYPTAFDLT